MWSNHREASSSRAQHTYEATPAADVGSEDRAEDGGSGGGGGASLTEPLTRPAGADDDSDACRVPPISLRVNLGVTLLLTAAAVLVVELVLPMYDGRRGLGMPLWGTLLCVAYAFIASYAVALVYATTGQNFAGGVCILAQIICGVLVPGSARANILAVMVINSATSQSMGVLTDLKTGLYAPSSLLAPTHCCAS